MLSLAVPALHCQIWIMALQLRSVQLSVMCTGGVESIKFPSPNSTMPTPFVTLPPSWDHRLIHIALL